jgi:cation diffusion facilitator family transporter
MHEQGEQRTTQVVALTAITMVVEIIAGIAFGSMALLADGWHMSTHTAAFALTIFAYRYAKKHARSASFCFGTGKVSVLGGFASAIALAVIALVMALESVERLVAPKETLFDQAIAVAVLGLLVNLLSAFILQGHPGHAHHDHEHSDAHAHHQQDDHNLRGAYLHVLADALTSVLAIIALTGGKFLGWHWLDPMMGIVGAIVITRWSYGLLQETASILLDGTIDVESKLVIKERIETEGDNRVSDLHVWKVGPGDYAAIVSVVTCSPQSPEHYKGLLKGIHELSHVTVEVNQCPGTPSLIAQTA